MDQKHRFAKLAYWFRTPCRGRAFSLTANPLAAGFAFYFRLAVAVSLVLLAKPADAASIAINGATTYQVIDGFGVNLNSQSWTNDDLKPVLDAFIDQAGMTLFEVIIGNSNWEASNDNSDPNVMNWTYYNSVFNAPYFQKEAGMMAYLNQRGITNGAIPKVGGPLALWMGGLTLKPGFENEYAETMAALFFYMRNTQHLQFTEVRAVEEPDIQYTGVTMSSAQLVTAMHDLGLLLDANGMSDLRFTGPELAYASSATAWISAMMADPYLMSKVAHYGVHSYLNETADASGIYNFIKQSKYPNIPFWMTEYNVWCTSCQNGTGPDNSWSYAQGSASFLLTLLSQGAAAGIVFEGYDSQYGGYDATTGLTLPLGPWSYWGLFGVDNVNATPKTYTPRKAFYTFSQVSKYVRPGAQQIGVSGSATPFQLLAFYQPVSGQLSIVGVNTSTSAAALSGTLASLPTISSLSLIYTDSSTNLNPSATFPVANGAFTATIPANCVFTLTSTNAFQPSVSVQLTNPVNGAYYIAPATIPLQATAATASGSITNVAFFAGSTALGQASQAPYGLTWSNVGAGTYVLSAAATNSLGQFGVSPGVQVTVVGSPQMTTQPTNQAVLAGSAVTFSTAAIGTVPLGFQWLWNGAGLADGSQYSGTATPTLTLSNAQPSSGGGYSVVVTNVSGAVTSSVAALTVTVPGSCVTPPAGLVGWWPGDGSAANYLGTNNGTLQGGATATAVGVDGSAFSFNGTTAYVQIPDSPILRPTNVTVEAWVNFSSLNSSGTAPAGEQYIVFKQNTRSGNFEGYFLGKLRGAGGDYFVFGVSSSTGVPAVASGTPGIQAGVWYHVAGVRGPNSVQLYVNGQLASQTSASFAQNYGTLPLYFGSSGQSFWDGKLAGLLDEVSLYNRALSASEIAAIYSAGAAGKCKAGSPPGIGSQPQGQNVAVGGSATLNVSASGTAPLSYQWLFNGNGISDGGAYSGTATATLAINNAQTANAGNYSVVVTNLVGSVTSAVAVVSVLVPPTMTSQPVSQAVTAGTAASFSATASGSAPLSYQWKLSGVNLANSARMSGATSTALTIASVQAADAGNYTLVVTNAVGVVTSSVAVLTVYGPPIITQQPSTQNVQAGANVNLSVVASGTAPLSYGWLFNGTGLSDGGAYSGSATASLAISNAQPINAGGYSVVVTNVAGAVTSSVAALTVTAPGSCVTPPSGLVGWWPGDGSGTNYFGTNNGSLQGGATATAAGVDGQAFSFNGTTAYVQIPDSPILRPTNVTVEAWVNFSSLNSSGTAPAGEQYIVFKQNTRSGNFEGYFLGKLRGAGGDYFAFGVSSSAGVPAVASGTPGIQAGVWYHVAGVRGPNSVQLYVNGQLASQTSVSFAQNYGTLPLYFGSSGQSFWDGKLAGLLDEVSLYNRALSASEIAAIYSAGAAGKCKSGGGALIVSQPFIEGNGGITSASYANHSAELQAEAVPWLTARQPSIQSVVLKNGTAVITWSAQAGSMYRVQFTEDLGSADWKDVQPDVQATGPTATAIDLLGNDSQRFYRILLLR